MRIRNNNLLDKLINVITVLLLGIVVFISYVTASFGVFVVGLLIVIAVRRFTFYFVYSSFSETASLIDYLDSSHAEKRNMHKFTREAKRRSKAKDEEIIKALKEEAGNAKQKNELG